MGPAGDRCMTTSARPRIPRPGGGRSTPWRPTPGGRSRRPATGSKRVGPPWVPPAADAPGRTKRSGAASGFGAVARGPTELCPRCGTVASLGEGFCRQCGLPLAPRGGIATYLRSLPNPWFSLVHFAALTVAIVALLLGDTSLHLCGVSILVLVGASLRLHHRTSPQYRVMRRRAEVRRRIRGARISVAVPVDGGPGRTVTIRSTVLRVPHLPHDEVLVRADSP